MPFTIALIGRPNVGKSTLFNKLAGRNLAIVDDMPGVTRDRKEADGQLGPLHFRIVDTAGLENDISDQQLEARMVRQTEMAIFDADLCLFIVDGRAGITVSDRYFADWLRRQSINTVLVVNKCEGRTGEYGFDGEYYSLGFGEPVGISAEHREGFNFLYDKIEPFYDEYHRKIKGLEVDSGGMDVDDSDERPIQIAIAGRPNAGKSTLINSLLGQDRLVVGPEAGITRDSIAIDWNYKGRKIRLIDTAGIRKQMQISKKLEQASVEDSFRSIRFAQIVVLMIDSQSPLDKQDLSLAGMVIREGRGLVFALNKWDLIPADQQHALLNSIIKQVGENFSNIRQLPIVTLSAINNKNTDRLMDTCVKVYEDWNRHLKTSELNMWLKAVQERNPPPLFNGRAVRLKYITQAKKRPPSFVLFTNSPERLKNTSYDRFLMNALREDFGLDNTVIRLMLRKAENPYAEKAKREAKPSRRQALRRERRKR